MKHLSLIALLIAASPAIMAEDASYKLEVNDFTELKVLNSINVDYRCSADSAGWAYFDCSPEIASRLMFNNNKSRLQIEIADPELPISGVPTITVYSTLLDKVENSGDSLVRINNGIAVKEFKATLIGNGQLIVKGLSANKLNATIAAGNGQLVISGKTRSAKLKNVGTGTVECADLSAEDVNAWLFGSGPIDCNATTSLTVYGAGSGKVYYGTKPEKISNRSMGVKILDANAK